MFAAVLASPLSRIVPIGMILLALQKTLFLELVPFGVYVQVVMAYAASMGAVGGSERGAIAGFALGLMVDLTFGTPLGSTAISVGLAGYIAGLVDLFRIDTTWWMAAVFVGFGTGVGEATVPVVDFFIGEDDAFPPNLWTIVLVVAVAGAIASLVLVPLGRWSLRLGRPEWKVPTDA